VVDTESESIVIDDNGKPENIIKKTTVLRPKEFAEITKMMQAFGILPQTPTIAIQNNNTNNQTQEAIAKTKEIPQIVFKACENVKND
jgi:hypothetical protein